MRLNLNKTLRAALIAAFTTVGLSLTQASGAITAENAAGWAVYQDSAWKTSDSFVGSITSSAQSDIQFKDASGNLITFGSGSRSAYTFAVELDLSKLTTPTSNTSMVWGSNKVGFGVEASTRKVTAAIGSNPKWNTTNTALATTGTATIVVTTGDGGSRIFGYDSTGASLFSSSWGNLKEGNPSTHFYIAQAISSAVTKFAVWQTGNGTASEADMKDAYSAMKEFPLAPPAEFTWNGTEQGAAWNTTSTVWRSGEQDVNYISSGTSTAIFNAGEFAKEVAVSGAIMAGTVNVNDSYTFTVAADNSLTVGTLSVADDKTATVAGDGTISLSALTGAGKLALGENTQVSLGAISGTNTFSLAAGSVLEMAFSGLPATLTAEGAGAIRLLKGADQNTTLTTITAPILKLAADSSHNSRFVYNNSSNLSGVQNLYFDGAQLWLNSGTSALNFAGTVTFGTENHYSEGANLDSAMRVNSSAKFSGAVDVQKDAKITWQAGNQSVEFAGAVTGSGNLTLATYNNGAQNGSKFIIGGDASQFAGALNVNHASITLEIKEGAKLNIGSGSDLKGAVSLNGELSVNGAAAISGNITGTGSIIKNGDGTLVLSGAANVLSHTIVVNAGYMTLSGGFEIGGIAPTDGETIYEGGQSDKNGYETARGNIVVYTGEGVTTTGGSFTYHGESVELNNGVYTLPGEKDTTTFYINEGTESYSWIDDHKTEDFSNIVVKQAGTLQVNKNINMSLVSTESRGTVQIDSGIVATGTSDGHVTLTGSGIYALTDGTVALGNVTLGSEWTGTVRIHDAAVNNVDFKTLVNGTDSTLELMGYSGYPVAWYEQVEGGLNPQNIKLTNGSNGYAFKYTGSTIYDNHVVTFSGNWSGDGTMQTAGNHLNYKFTGDISDWNGKLQVASGIPHITFSGDADEVNAIIDKNGKTLDLIVGEGTAFSTTFKATVDATSLTVSDLAAATFEADATFGSLSGTGKVAVNEGATLTVSGTVGSDVQIDAADGATIDAELAPTQVGIAADSTATFAQGIQDASGVVFYGEEGVQVKNTNEAGGDALLYDISKENAKVTADTLGVDSGTAVTVKNEVVVWGIANFGEGDLTLTHVDVEPLESVNAYDGDLTLQNIAEVSLVEIEIASGSTVAVYKGAVADATQEGTVTITEKLKAGGGTLLANLEMADGSKLAVNGGGENALTLGSQFTIAEGAIVRLDDATLAALDNLAVGGSLTLIKALDQTTLGYGQDYAGTWYDAMFSRVDGEYSLAGDFQVFANETGFGLTKVSNVPEPTTGTLSLLALAALCMRRRRK